MSDIQRRRKKKRRARTITGIKAGLITALALVVIVSTIALVGRLIKGTPLDNGISDKNHAAHGDGQETNEPQTQSPDDIKMAALDLAYKQSCGYDYEKAVETIKAIPGYEKDAELLKKISEYDAARQQLVRYEDPTKITHIFFHSLIVDTKKAFASDSASGYNMVMTTVDEFNKILQSMYDKGFVLVSLHDIAKETTDENGNVTFAPGDIMLPPGKQPFVLSQDDVCYYEYMEDTGFATRIVLDENGRPTCEYKQDDGTVVQGDYDLVPLLNKFIDEHPDFSYKGAKGILALTGYNGVLGYRTDPEVYKDSPTLNEDIEAAKKVAQGLKDDGWEFASHSWGHLHLKQIGWDKFKEDTDKWEKNVESIIGETDIMIYPFGEDVGDWRPYAADNQKYAYLKSVGFNYFCNVDGNQYWVQFNGDNIRQGRRNIDGQRMWQEMNEAAPHWLTDLFDVRQVFDQSRPTPVYDIQ